MAFAGAAVQSGIETVLELVRFDALVGDAALVITGEGRLDAQTARGKAPAGVAAHARALGVPVIALAGWLDADPAALAAAGFAAAIPLMPRPAALDEALAHAAAWLADAAERTIRLIALGEQLNRPR
jgi:glycerate kinase